MNPNLLRPVVKFAAELTEHGLEGYDAAQKGTLQAATNIGGAKVWNDPFRSPLFSNLEIYHPGLKQVITDASVLVYTLSRVQLNADGNPVMTSTGSGYNRVNQGLMLYPQFDDSPATAVGIRKRILEVLVKPGYADYVEIASNIPVPSLKALEKITFKNFEGVDENLKLTCCILLAFPSGAPGRGQFWGTKPKATNRQTMSARTSLGGVDSADLPM